MEKRFGVMWRVAVVLLVIISIAPVIALSGSSQADETPRPETYMNPFPQYMNAALVGAHLSVSGTSLQSSDNRPVSDVQVQVQRNSDGFCWDAGSTSWVDDADRWNSALIGPPVGTCAVETWTTDQWAWSFVAGPATANLDSGNTQGYTVRARAKNNANYVDLSPSQRTFWYDNLPPDVGISTIIPSTVNSLTTPLTTITGTASDDDGTVDQVRVRIRKGAAPPYYYWNGFTWKTGAGANVWIKAQGTNSWNIGLTTSPPLPEWVNDQTYRVEAQVSDKANNRFTLTGSNFLFRKELTSASCYIDPVPAYVDATFTGFSGTSQATAGQTIIDVQVEIRDQTNNAYWDDTGGVWVSSTTWSGYGTASWTHCADDNTPTAVGDQFDWTLNTITDTSVAVPWVDGHTYQVRCRAQDSAGTPAYYTSATDSFIYDTAKPGSNIDAFAGVVYNSWTGMTGQSGDTYGQIGAVIALIQRVPPLGDNLYWNGAGWGANPWGGANAWDWVFATASGTTSVTWSVTSSTTPALPPMVNDMNYHIEVHAMDKAGNEETTATKDFQFRMDLSGYTPPVPTATSTGGPTETGGPTNTSTGGGGGGGGGTGATATATTVVATPTYTYVPPVATATPTATTLPGFSGSATIGPAGGTVTANDNDGNPRVTATFGANALSASADVSISGSGTCTGTVPEGYVFGNSCFDITPSQALGAMVEICVHYTAADVMAAGGDPANLRLAYKDAEGNWKVLDTILNTAAGTICAETDHLSSWAVMGATEASKEERELWWYVGIGIGAVIIVLLFVYLIARPRGKGAEGEGEEHGEGDYEEGEV